MSAPQYATKRRQADLMLAGALLVGHLTMVVLHLTHKDISPLAYNSQAVSDFVHGPTITIVHALAAGAIVMALLMWNAWKNVASLVSAAAFAAQAVVLFVSAYNHTPRGALTGAALAAVVFLFAVVAVRSWSSYDQYE